MKELSEIETIENIREQLIKPKMLQLHTGLEGYESPDTYGIYKNTGGQALGVVGSRYKPLDLNILLDSVVESVRNCPLDVDISTLEYKEYRGGSKVALSLDLPTVELETPMVGDIVDRRLEFRTGFDGKTRTTINEYRFRLWCENGCASKESHSLGFKNTLNNNVKIYNLCNEIMSQVEKGDEYFFALNESVKKDMNKRKLNDFIEKVTGYNVSEYKELTTRKKNILDDINQAIAIEMQNTGSNMFSAYTGITRYVTHDRADGNEEDIIYSPTNSKILNRAEVALYN